MTNFSVTVPKRFAEYGGLAVLLLGYALLLVWNFHDLSCPRGGGSVLAAAGLLYILSQGLRALRLWVVVADAQLSVTDLWSISMVGNLFGGIVGKPIGELVKLGLFSYFFSRRIWRLLFAFIYVRLVDLGYVLLLWMIFQDNKPQIGLLLLMLFLFLSICLISLPAILNRLVSYLIRFKDGAWTPKTIQLLNKVRQEFLATGIYRLDTLPLTLALTLLLWMFELLAVLILTGELTKLLSDGSNPFLFLNQMFAGLFQGNWHSETYRLLYAVMGIVSLLMLPSLKRLKK